MDRAEWRRLLITPVKYRGQWVHQLLHEEAEEDGWLPELADLAGQFSTGPEVGIVGSPRFTYNGCGSGGDGSTVYGRFPTPVDDPANCGPNMDQPCFLPAVSLHRSGVVQCSGVLVSHEWVLTAAHCACPLAANKASLGEATPSL